MYIYIGINLFDSRSYNINIRSYLFLDSKTEEYIMKLILNRSQKPGMLSSTVKFSLDARVHLSEGEATSVKKYKMGKEVLYSKDRMGMNPYDMHSAGGLAKNLIAAAAVVSITVDDLIKGKVIECKDILEMTGIVEQIKEASGVFKMMLDSASDFEGEEILDY